MDNEFVAIPGHPQYEINRGGEIRNIITQKNIKQRINSTGYPMASFDSTYYLIHRLVAKIFIPNPKNLATINHINGIKTDNRLENLEWCTIQENIHHAYNTGLANQKGGENSNAKLTKQNILDIHILLKSGCALNEIAKKFNVSMSHISNIKAKRFWKHI